MVYDKRNPEKRVSYASLAKGKRIERHLEEKPEVKSYTEYRIMNRPALRRDAVEKTTGKAVYAGDVRLPGMLYARILRPPAHGAVLKSVDTVAAESMPGVRVIRDDDFIAVLHEQPEKETKKRFRRVTFFPYAANCRIAISMHGSIRTDVDRTPSELPEHLAGSPVYLRQIIHETCA